MIPRVWIIETGDDYHDLSFACLTQRLSSAFKYAELQMSRVIKQDMKWIETHTSTQAQFVAQLPNNQIVARITQVEIHS